MLVSIIIPCFNEESFIAGCIQSVLAFDLPDLVSTELFIVDGSSTDGTLGEISKTISDRENIHVLRNPARIQSCGLNMAIRQLKGDWMLRLDAHAIYPQNYLKLCIETALRTGADNIGGVFVSHPRGDSYEAKIVQALTTHPFGIGNARYRLGGVEGVADTVPYGFFRVDRMNRIGYFDERLVRAQDYEYNRRIRAAGGTIWQNPNIEVHYFNQSSLRLFLRKQFELEAPYNTYMWHLAPYSFSLRHGITGAFVIALVVGLFVISLLSFVARDLSIVLGAIYGATLLLYTLLAIAASIQQAMLYHDARHIVVLPICFFAFHFAHGAGIVMGLFRLLRKVSPVQRICEPWQGAGRYRAWPVSEN